MSKYPECVQALVNAGAFDALLHILATWRKEADMVKDDLETIGRLGCTKDNMTKVIVSMGGAEAVVATLKEYGPNADMSKVVILLIESAAHVPACLDPLRKAGAVAAVLQAMSANKADAALQALGNRCLERLAGKGQVKEAVDHLGVMIKECIAMDVAQMSGDNLLSAVNLLANLSLQEGSLSQLIGAGALDALVSSLQAGLKLPAGEQQSAIFALASKALAAFCKDPTCAKNFVAAGGMAAVMKASLKDLENEELAESALEIAMLCARDPLNVSRMVQDGAVEDMVAMMKAFPFNEKIQLNALKALAAYARNGHGPRSSSSARQRRTALVGTRIGTRTAATPFFG
jgi:hypothetical protein